MREPNLVLRAPTAAWVGRLKSSDEELDRLLLDRRPPFIEAAGPETAGGEDVADPIRWMRSPKERIARKAHRRYVFAVGYYCDWETMTDTQRTDHRDFAWTARDCLGLAFDDWDAEQGLARRRYWWETHDGPWLARKVRLVKVAGGEER